ncbi:MAG: exodeoxyribonuclease III [Selenomonadaceae bacterium]|nr:exodeoxyribonuclease III [Selenomonadaceae bacterium]
MKILSWNINGLISWIESKSYLEIEKFDADVICLQETRTQRRLTAMSGYCHYWNLCERDGMHGTMTMTKKEPLNVIYGLGVKELDVEGRVLTVEFPKFFVVNCYAPRAATLERHAFRRKWDKALKNFVKNLLDSGKQVILCGDFNVLRTKIDIYPENEREHYALQGIISDERSNLENLLEIGFVDAFRHKYPKEKYSYTFWSNRRYKRRENRGWRLDYFFVSKNAATAIKEVKHLTEIYGSDHAPIFLEMEHFYSDDDLAEIWNNTDWLKAEKTLEEYQKALTRAVRERDFKKVENIQNQIVNSKLIKRLAVRSVSNRTNTAGVDNVRWNTSVEKFLAVGKLNKKPYKASPLRQIILIDKGTGKERYIGVPTMYDRAMHKLYSYALAPVMEATSEKFSFGFRKGRSSFDLHENLKKMLTSPTAPQFIVKSDIKAFYATIQHDWLIKNIPMDKEILKEFLQAGHIFAGELYPSNEMGISEGSSISPLLANIILNGLQKYIYKSIGVWRENGKMDWENGRMIRYVDDVIFTVRSENFGKKVIVALENFLSERGLTISVEKTFICPITSKFSFLSRTYWIENNVLLTTPSDEAVGKFITELEQSVMRNIENKSQREIIRLLNRKLKGWAGYHRITDAKNSFRKIDAALHGILLKATFSKHPKMSHEKVIKKYWYKDADGKYIFALPNDKSVRLISISDIPLINYEPISAKMNPYTDAGYFESRTHEKAIQHITAKYRPIWNRQGGKCKYCGRFILPDQKRSLVPINLFEPMSFENSAYVHECCKENELDYIGYTENPHDLRETDVMRLLEEVARIREKRTHNKISYIKRKWLPGDTIWTHILLKRYFAISVEEKITLTFKQIEEIEGKKLRPESKKAEFWLEQKKSYKTIADTWKSEGYELENLDLENEKITLRRLNPKSLLKVPDELTRQKLPADAIFELETHFNYIIEKYGLKFC